jgi:hypothetical protein
MARQTGRAGSDEMTRWGVDFILQKSCMSTKILWYTINIRVCSEPSVPRESL